MPDVVHLVARDLVDDPRALRAAKAAAEAGFRVTAICRLSRNIQPTPVEGLRVLGVPGGGLTARLRDRGGTSRRYGRLDPVIRPVGRIARQLGWAVRVALLQPRADIVHAHDLETLPAGLLVSRSTTLIYDAHELYADWEGATHGFYRRYCRWIEGAAASRAKAFVTVSDGIADTLAARYEGSQPIVVLNTPDVAFRPRPAGIPDGKVRVIYQGIFTAGRGIETLLDAARLLPECEISIRGFGPLEDEFRALAREAHAAVLPAVSPDRILEGLDGFHIGVVPYEPRTLNNVLCLPNKLFEYMAAGLAIVAADLPELRRVISDTGAGTTFTPGDPVSLAEAIRVLADPTRLATAQERAATAADGEYSWRHQRTVLQQLYRELCAAS